MHPSQMRVLIIADITAHQVNGVVRTLNCLKQELTALGHQVSFITSNDFSTFQWPSYPEIQFTLWPVGLYRRIRQFQPDAIHIATEGPLGFATRHYCVQNGLPFTTSFHTRLPDYLKTHMLMPKPVTEKFLQWFHSAASATMVSTASLEAELSAAGFRNLQRWSRGVDTHLFRPRDKGFLTIPRPASLYVGRVAPEKNIEAFLSLKLPGTKVVVGDGPSLRAMQQLYPDVLFVGAQSGESLAQYYAACDVFVFPSRTDTFGLVMLEALASGLPVAAFPVQAAQDVIGHHGVGCLDEDLGAAIQRALLIPSQRCRGYTMQYTWQASAGQFLSHLAPISPGALVSNQA